MGIGDWAQSPIPSLFPNKIKLNIKFKLIKMSSYNNINNNQRFMLTDDQINLLKEAFDLFDMEKTGQIDFHELKLTLKAFGFKVSKEEMYIIKKKIRP